jgi:hypothetical protein
LAKQPVKYSKGTKNKNTQPEGFPNQAKSFILEHRVRLAIYTIVTIIFIIFATWRRLQFDPDIGLAKSLWLGILYGLVLFAVLISNIFIGIYLRRSAERDKKKT